MEKIGPPKPTICELPMCKEHRSILLNTEGGLVCYENGETITSEDMTVMAIAFLYSWEDMGYEGDPFIPDWYAV